MAESNDISSTSEPSLTTRARYVILVFAFLGWMLAGMHLSITGLASSPVSMDLLNVDLESGTLRDVDKPRVTSWYGWIKSGFLIGAALGGLVFGRLGDRFGRTKALGLAILCYSVMTGIAYFAETPGQFLVLRFLAGLGVGGTWPNGVSLVAEAWSNLSRPMLAGVMGTSANVGILAFSQLTAMEAWKITPDSWRWVMVLGFSPVVLGLICILLVPESPRWLQSRKESTTETQTKVGFTEIFRPPLLATTLVGIGLASVPLIGGWGSSSWIIPWADQMDMGTLKSKISVYRSLTGVVGSLLGGWFASLLGRRRCYLLTSLFALICAQYTFWFLEPTHPMFLFWVAALGFFSGIYFGWLPLCLPELFVTRVRSTGAGVSFNFGRILTVVTILTTSTMIVMLGSNFPLIGKVTSLIYAIGIVLIVLAPIKSDGELQD